jgi:hypothetical protein
LPRYCLLDCHRIVQPFINIVSRCSSYLNGRTLHLPLKIAWIRYTSRNAMAILSLNSRVRRRPHRGREVSRVGPLVAARRRRRVVTVNAIRRAATAAGGPRIGELRIEPGVPSVQRGRYRRGFVQQRLEDAGQPAGRRTRFRPVLLFAWKGWVARWALWLVAGRPSIVVVYHARKVRR